MYKTESDILSVPVMGISRFRIGTDGEGITTLVAFQDCPLRCTYCLNKECWESADHFKHYTPKELYEEVKKDDLYFRATGGGITFGGGEPALRADFIVAFRKLCGKDWKIRLETSLNVNQSLIDKFAHVVDEWIIDIKSYKESTYEKYTKRSQFQLSNNLEYLLSKTGLNVPKEKVMLKVPVIPQYVSIKEADKTVSIYHSLYGCKVEKVFYKDNEELEFHKDKIRERDGKKICELLKQIKREIIQKYGLIFNERDCTHKGNCPGTCPLCESEVSDLLRQLREKGIEEIVISEAISKMIGNKDRNQREKNNTQDELKEPQGKIILPDDKEPIGGLVVHEEYEDFLEGEEIPRPIEEEPLQGEPVPFPRKPDISEFFEYKKIFFKECAIAGISFHVEADDEIWMELEEGTELALIRDRNNKHDKNAIAVALADDYNGDPEDFDFELVLGYIPRNENSDLATMFDAGYANKFSAKITTLKTYGNVNSRIRITIFIESNKPHLVRPNLFRGNTLNSWELQNMNLELKEYGVAYFRFGGYPLSDYIMPTVGEKIVMFYPDSDKMVLYLTRVMAEGEDCSRYKKEWGDLYIDDQIGYVISVISGPIIVEGSELFFMFDSDINNLSAEDYLNSYETSNLSKLFDKVLFNIVDRGNFDPDPPIDSAELRKENKEDEGIER